MSIPYLSTLLCQGGKNLKNTIIIVSISIAACVSGINVVNPTLTVLFAEDYLYLDFR